MVWQLALWTWQLVLTLCWLWYIPAASSSLLRWMAYLSVIACATMCIWCLAKLHRHRLWRRRKSARPSKEIQIERRRIARSLHDVLGSQLVFALSLCSSKQDATLHQTLEHGLLHLRLIVDSMDMQDDALALCMARFRHRVQPILNRREIVLHWYVCEDDDFPSPDQSLRGQAAQHILAVLQEAVSNILQHAYAREIWVRLDIDPSPTTTTQHHRRGYLSVEDNGRGIPSDGLTGMGIASMRQRAQDIGGQLQISPRDGGGTCLHLSW